LSPGARTAEQVGLAQCAKPTSPSVIGTTHSPGFVNQIDSREVSFMAAA
jgi:hypothetical protein